MATTPKDALPSPNPNQPIASDAEGRPVKVDQDWQQKFDAMVKRINDHETRIAALEP